MRPELTLKRSILSRLTIAAVLPTHNKYGFRRPPTVIRFPATIKWIVQSRQSESYQEFWKNELTQWTFWGWVLMLWIGWEMQYRTQAEFPPG